MPDQNDGSFTYEAETARQNPVGNVMETSEANYCPICDSEVENFLPHGPHGHTPRPNARCPVCDSLERHRLDWLFFHQRTNLFSDEPVKLLHIAPERFLTNHFSQLKNVDYLTADLLREDVMVKMDLTDIHYPDNSFTAIYCSHVLEHIPDDRKAMSELHRVLSPGGWALLQVPITSETTYEDFSITDPDARNEHFGQWDHVRRCGPDYIERMRAAGFDAEALRSTDIVSEEECDRMGFQRKRLLFFCRK